MGLVDRRPVVCPTLAIGFWEPLQYLRIRQRIGLIVLLRPDGGFPGLSEVLQPLLALNTFSLQVQQPSEFLSVMLRQWHVISSRPRQSISTPGYGFTRVHRLHV